ncbi:MAG: hypothetical protein AAF944_04545 [Bacteroidota bacterium]
MRSRKDIGVFFAIFVLTSSISITFPWKASLGQTVVGMGTDSPNPNAVLELVAKDKNQGLLIPRLSESNIATLAQQLTSRDQGLLIFAEEQGKFCYWWNGTWNVLNVTSESGTGSPSTPENPVYQSGEGITIEGQTVRNTGDLDSTNELQSLASVLNQGADANQQRITNVANPVDSQDVATRAFVLQQQQDLLMEGNTLSFTDNSSPVNLSATTPSNGQVLTWINASNQWESRSVPGATPYTAGTGISIDGSNQVINTAPDQAVTLSGNGSVTIGGTYPDFTISGTDSVDDADNSPTNEIITSTSLEADDILRIEEAGTNHTIDLSRFQKRALPEGELLIGNVSGVATPVSLSGDATLNADGTLTITLDAVTTDKIINQAITTAKLANNAVTREKINSNVAGSGLNQAANGSLQTSNTASGEILIGQGTQAAARAISGDVILAADGGTTVEGLQGRSVSSTAPSSGEVLTWDGSSWVPDHMSGGPFIGGGDQWYSGTGTPTALNPLDAENGDFYYETDSQIVYYKEGGSWTELGGFNRVNPVSEVNGLADSYRTPVLLIGDGVPNDGDDFGEDGDFYYSRDSERMYYRYNDGSTIIWREL